jgi:hypothetical protein
MERFLLMPMNVHGSCRGSSCNRQADELGVNRKQGLQVFQRIGKNGMNYDELTKSELIEELTAVKKQHSKTLKAGKTISRGDSGGKRRVQPKKSGNAPSPAGHATERRYRVKSEDGTVRQIYEVVKDVHDEKGIPLYTEGALYEITGSDSLNGDTSSAELTESSAGSALMGPSPI